MSPPPDLGKISNDLPATTSQGIAVSDFLALVAPLASLEAHQWVGIVAASTAGTAVMWIGILAGWWWARR